jgi:hypothetical protein
MEWPGRIATVEEVDIETTRGAGAPVHRTMVRDEIAPTTVRLEPR